MNSLLLALQLLVSDTSEHPFPYSIKSAFTDGPTWFYGWMSSRFLERIQ